MLIRSICRKYKHHKTSPVNLASQGWKRLIPALLSLAQLAEASQLKGSDKPEDCFSISWQQSIIKPSIFQWSHIRIYFSVIYSKSMTEEDIDTVAHGFPMQHLYHHISCADAPVSIFRLGELLCAKGSGKKCPQALPGQYCQVVISVQYNFHGAS